VAFVYFFIYETKGLSLEEVDELYNEVGSARKSTGWEPTITFKEREATAGHEGVLDLGSEKADLTNIVHKLSHDNVESGGHAEVV
jgi:SP family sugar:H+ symporter-like MFS transporter